LTGEISENVGKVKITKTSPVLSTFANDSLTVLTNQRMTSHLGETQDLLNS